MIDPRGMRDVVEWADFITLPLNQIGVTPRRLDHPDHWQSWAFHLIQSASLEGFETPDPRYFTDWVDWANRFNEAVLY